MKYLVIPADFKTESVEYFDCLNEQSSDMKIKEIYGNIPSKLFGSGRAAQTLPEINSNQFEKYLKQLKSKGIDFSYTFNQSCFRNMEFTPKGYSNILFFIGYLWEIGVARLIVSAPSVIEIIKKHFPRIHISVSVIARVDTLGKARAYRDLGVDRINIFEDATKNFVFLKELANSLKIETEIIVNSKCIINCPFRDYHYNCQAHSNLICRPHIIDSWFNRCNLAILENPLNLLKKPALIRPEDISFYDKIGINYFKIIGREETSCDSVRKIVKIYMGQHYDGNLFDLLSSHNFGKNLFYLNNKDLTGFLKYFIDKNPSCQLGCYDCDYCQRIAKKIKYSKKNLKKQLASLRKSVGGFCLKGV